MIVLSEKEAPQGTNLSTAVRDLWGSISTRACAGHLFRPFPKCLFLPPPPPPPPNYLSLFLSWGPPRRQGLGCQVRFCPHVVTPRSQGLSSQLTPPPLYKLCPCAVSEDELWRFAGQMGQCVSRLRRVILDEGIRLSVGTYCWTFHRSADKLCPCPSYSRRRDRIDLVPNLIRYKWSAAT